MTARRLPLLAGLLVLLAAACAPADSRQPASAAAADFPLNASQKAAIGRKIWQNECGGTIEGLTTWNTGEEFPSLGIGHFIWYPAHFRGLFQESWPAFIAFARQQGARPPALAGLRHSPWNSRAEFQRDFHSPRMRELRGWLAGQVPLQTEFILQRSRQALPRMLAAAPPAERSRIAANHRKVATTPHGAYALIDYVNFKGEGTNPAEHYQGRGWGLLQVLGEMREAPAGPAAASEFSAAAKRVLSRRIALSPPERREKRWEAGWHNRCETYARPL